MKTIEAQVQASRKLMNTHCNSLTTVFSEENKAFLTKFPNRSDVERVYAPNLWGYTLNYPERAFKAECPTLLTYDKLYGEGSSTIWIHIHVTALYGASPSKDKELANSIAIFSETFSAEVRLYKLSELMLFFGRYKAGRYDNSYQSFDTKRIGNAFFKEFLPQWRNEIALYIHRQQQEAYLESRELPKGYVVPEGYNPDTWYRERLKRGEIKPIEP